MKKLSFVARLTLSTVAFAIPILVLIHQMYTAKTVNIDFAAQEELGNRYQRPLEAALEAVSRHKVLLLRASLGDTSEAKALSDAAEKADAAFSQLLAVDREIGPDLQFTPEGLGKRKREQFTAQNMNQTWTEIKQLVTQKSTESALAKHQDLIAGIRTMITHAGDTSNLILDPDLDSYYLMDVTLAALPQTQDHIQDIISRVEPLLAHATLTPDERVQLAVDAYMLKESDLARIKGSGDTALNEDSNFYETSPSLQKNLPPALALTNEKVGAFISLLTDLSVGKSVSEREFREAGNSALEASHSAWRTAVTELDILLDRRIAALATDRRQAVTYAGLALVAAILFSAYVGYTLRQSIGSILNSVRRLRESANSTAATSANLVDASQQVSASTTEQAAAIQETVATLNEIDAMVGRSVENANRSAELSKTSHDVAGQGKRAVEDMIAAINEISASNEHVMTEVNRSNERLADITKVIGEIATKTKVINDIVFQTKLLSFNASVEAARAGENGKGFAVVAEEVGNLAQMSGHAADEINGLLTSSLNHVSQIVTETKATVEELIRTGRLKIESGTRVAERCGEVLEEVVRNVNEVNCMMDEIAAAQREQAQGVHQISEAMQQLDSTTHKNAESAEKTSEFAESLSRQADDLRGLVNSVEAELLGRNTVAAPVVPLIPPQATHASPAPEAVSESAESSRPVHRTQKFG